MKIKTQPNGLLSFDNLLIDDLEMIQEGIIRLREDARKEGYNLEWARTFSISEAIDNALIKLKTPSHELQQTTH